MSDIDSTSSMDTPSGQDTTIASDVSAIVSDTAEGKAKAFDLVARHGSMDDYVAERRDQDAEANGDPSIDRQERKFTRSERYRRTIAALRAENESLKRGDSDDRKQAQRETQASSLESLAADQAGQTEPAEADTDINARIQFERVGAVFEARANEYETTNPGFRDRIERVMQVLPINQQAVMLMATSDMGPALLDTFAEVPEAILELNALSPLEQAKYIGGIESRLRAEREQRQALSGNGRSRFISKAPKPMTYPTGGATPPKDPSKMTMDEYAAWRRNGGS